MKDKARGIFCFLLIGVIYNLALSQSYELRIIDALNQQPVASAVITHGDTALTLTNDDGLAVFEVLPDSFSIHHLGYTSATFSAKTIQGTFQTLWLSPKVNTIDAVVVRPAGPNRRVSEAGQSISTIDMRSPLTLTSMNINEQLSTVAGITSHNGNINTNRLVIRGIGARTQYGSNRIKVYLDHIPLTTGEGYVAPEEISPAYISQIQILKGGASALYGSGLGGAIVLHSVPYTDKKTDFVGRFEIGSFQTATASGLASGRSKNFRWTGFVSNTVSDGFRENSHYEQNNFGMKTNLLRKKFEINYSLFITNMEAHIPSSIDYVTYQTQPESAAQNWKDVQGNEANFKLISSILVGWKISKHLAFNSQIYTTLNAVDEVRPFNTLENKSFSIGTRNKLSYSRPKYTSEIIIEARTEKNRWKTFQDEFKSPPPWNDYLESRAELGIQLAQSFHLFPSLHVEANLGVHKQQYQKESQLNPRYEMQDFKPALSPMLSVNWQPFRFGSVYANVMQGISYPTSEDVFYNDVSLYKQLKPESGWTKEAGIRLQAFDRLLTTQICYYHTTTKNQLVSERISDMEFRTVNAGKALHRGVEQELQFNLSRPKSHMITQLQITGSGTYAFHTYDEFMNRGENYSGNTIPGIPKYQAALGTFMQTRFHVGIAANYLYSGQQQMNDANTGQYAGHRLLHGKILFDFNIKQMKAGLYVAINNVFDTHYASMILVNAPSFGGEAPRHYYPGAPRNYKAGIKLNF